MDRPCVGRSAGHVVGLISPANSNVVPSGLGLRPRAHVCFWSIFLCFSFSFLIFSFAFRFLFVLFLSFFVLRALSLFCFVLFFGCTCMPWTMNMFLVLLGLQDVREGIPLLVSIVPLRTGTAVVYTLFCTCFLPSRSFLSSLSSDHGRDLRDIGYVRTSIMMYWTFLLNG